jgi:tetratricopeptide (TPR) repeat protein
LLICLSAPIYLSQRHTSRALDEWPSDPEAAYEDLDRAADLNPLEAQPLLVEGAIASLVGDHDRAVDAFSGAADREPESYAAHIFLAEELVESDPVAAARSLTRAAELNPSGPEVRRLVAELAAG